MIKKIYRFILGLFEFIVDLLITVLAIYILNTIFYPSIYIKCLSYFILLIGLTYGFNDIYNIMNKENDNRKENDNS